MIQQVADGKLFIVRGNSTRPFYPRHNRIPKPCLVLVVMVPRNAGHIECEGLVQIDGLDLLITQYFRGLLGDLEIEFVTV